MLPFSSAGMSTRKPYYLSSYRSGRPSCWRTYKNNTNHHSLLAVRDRRYLGAFRPLAVSGHVSLFPLLFTPAGKTNQFMHAVALCSHVDRISNQDSVYYLLAYYFLNDFRSTSTGVWLDCLSIESKLNANSVYRSSRPRVFLLDRFSLLYVTVAIPLILYCSLVHQAIFGEKYEFIPLMFISSYSAIAVFASWVGFLVVYYTS